MPSAYDPLLDSKAFFEDLTGPDLEAMRDGMSKIVADLDEPAQARTCAAWWSRVCQEVLDTDTASMDSIKAAHRARLELGENPYARWLTTN